VKRVAGVDRETGRGLALGRVSGEALLEVDHREIGQACANVDAGGQGRLGGEEVDADDADRVPEKSIAK